MRRATLDLLLGLVFALLATVGVAATATADAVAYGYGGAAGTHAAASEGVGSGVACPLGSSEVANSRLTSVEGSGTTDPPIFVAPQTVSPSDIRLSQATVNGPKTSAYADSMRRSGWQGEPVDVVRMQDGGLTTFDNKRVVAANDAGIDVRANIHDFDAPFPAD